jgi:hypothetical protein
MIVHFEITVSAFIKVLSFKIFIIFVIKFSILARLLADLTNLCSLVYENGRT